MPEAPPGLHFWGERGATCEGGGCERPARWRPILIVPLDAGDDALAVPLPLGLCWRHRLPKREWEGMKDEKLRSSVARMAHPHRLVMAHAWIDHVPLAWSAEGHPTR